MKLRHKQAYNFDAMQILNTIDAAIGQDFHTLSSSQIDSLLEIAKSRRYQPPANRNGSKARYFYQMIQRRANSGKPQ